MSKKSFTVNIIYNLIYKILTVLFPLVSISIISRALLPQGVGKVSSAQNIVTYFTFLAPLGMGFYGTKQISKSSKENINKNFSECFLINAISTSICIIVYYIMINFVQYFEKERLLYSVCGLAIVLNLFNVDWFYQGKEEYRYIAVRSIIVKFLMLVAIVICIKQPADYVKYALIYVLGIAGNYIFNVLNLSKFGVKIIFKNLDIKRHLKPLFLLTISNIAVELYSLLDTTMLSIMCTSEIVGYYSNAIRLVKVVVLFIAAIGGTTLPRIVALKSEQKYNEINDIISNIIKVMALLAVPAAFGVFCLSDKIVLFMFGEAFQESIFTIKIFCSLFFTLTFSNFIGTQVLIAYDKEKQMVISTFCGAIVNIILNFILIRLYKQNGAAVASIVSEGIVAIIMFVYAKKEINISISFTYILKLLLSSIIMSALVLIIKNRVDNLFISIFVSVICAVFVYVICNILLKNEMIIKFLNIWMKKLYKNKS